MQYLAIAVVLAVSLFACRWYKQTVIVWMVAQTLFNAQIAVRYSTPSMSCVMATDFVLIGLYFFKARSASLQPKEYFLFKEAMIAILSSYILSTFFAIGISSAAITTTVKYFATNFVLLYIFQQCLKSTNDLKLFFRSVLIVSFLQTTNALYESIFQDNLWLDFVYFNSPHDASTLGRMFYIPPQLGNSLEMRYGMVRARSFFGLHISFGFFCLMYLHLLMTSYKNKWDFIKNKQILITVSILLFAGILMGNSKTSYIGFAIMLFSIYSTKQIFNPKIIFPLAIVAITITQLFPEYLNNFFSLFDSTLADEGGGSTIEGRKIQFQAAQSMFEMSPFVGNGPGSIGLLKSKGFGAILGAESSLMQILPERGLYGLAMYFLAFFCIFKRFKPVLGEKNLAFFLLAIIAMEFATGILDMTIWGTTLLVTRKAILLNRQGDSFVKG
ncbi:MAG: O-antigen ligase family protein [Fibrobacter sp.]|nr:O-antigen ligase family protein [Fibrobacter sp.]